MKDKVLQLLKTKYSNLGLSVKTLEGFAEQLATSITEESQIEGAVQGAEFYLKIAQGEADRARQEAKKNNPPQQQPTPEPPKQEPDTPEWQKAINALTQQISALTSKTVATSRKEQYEKTLKDLPAYIKQSKLKDFERMSFDTDEDFNSYLTEMSTEVSAINQELINSGLKTNVPQGEASKKVEQAQVVKDIETWAKDKK